MKEKKRILVVYPHNFFVQRTGTNTRYIELLKYFKNRGFAVDLLTLEGFCTSWQQYPEDKWGLLDNIYIYNFKKGARLQKFKNRKRNPITFIRKRIPGSKTYTDHPDFAYRGMKKRLTRILENNRYDFIVISYIYWANLLETPAVKQHGCTSVLTLEDFLTLNKFDSTAGNIKTGAMIETEIRRVDMFDKVLCISQEEKYFFSHFSQSPQYHYIPYFVESNLASIVTRFQYDMFFIGSDNPHNIKGIRWFLDNVFPLLEGTPRILIAGAVTSHIRGKTPQDGSEYPSNITFREYIDGLEQAYGSAKIAICPLLGGTGMKIKVVEALSYGKPVVTTSRGVSGFASRLQNGCTIADYPAAFARAITNLLQNDDFYRAQQELAVDFFLQHFEKHAIYAKLDDVFLKEKDE